MNLGQLKNLKELSWYTTVPLFVCAWIMQDIGIAQVELLSISGFVLTVGQYFVDVVVCLFISYAVLVFAVSHIKKDSFPLILLLATFILTLAGVGLGVFIIKPSQLTLPVNIIWFAALASVAFNLYEIQSGIHTKLT
ncbi:MAG TPA: hypothetical protein ENI61_05095 [Ignavibacteria bacterium]|nr:hypothetical protein [Ignavibacteria bacterium]